MANDEVTTQAYGFYKFLVFCLMIVMFGAFFTCYKVYELPQSLNCSDEFIPVKFEGSLKCPAGSYAEVVNNLPHAGIMCHCNKPASSSSGSSVSH